MAAHAYVASILASIPAQIRGPVSDAFGYVLDNWRMGRCTAGGRAENAQLYALSGTTSGTANAEFSIAHGLSSAPYLLIPILALDTVGQQLVPLKVTRAADSQRIYLSSSVTSAPIRVLVEGVR